MTLPRLRAALEDASCIARVIRGALRLEVEMVPLVAPPSSAGEHVLELDVPGEDIVVSLHAEPAGPPSAEGHPLRVRPMSRVQMADLFALVERLDDPSQTLPPPADQPFDEVSADDTLIDDSGVPLDLKPATGRSPWLGSDDSMAAPVSAGPPSWRSLTPVASPPPPGAATTSRAPAVVRSMLPRVPPATPQVPVDPRIGRTIASRYRIEALLGSGAAAAVYRALHVDLERPVAIKILHAQNQDDPQFVRRFKAEALAASKLEHPNVARVLDYGEDAPGELYLVMELLVGRTLEATLAAEGRLPQRRAVDIAIQVCRAIAFAHDGGVIHRDVKPENIMVLADRDDDGAHRDLVKVCDFGLAKPCAPDPDRGELTVAGTLCGSPAYMSPEQTSGEAVDVRTDVYSLGVMIFETLTGGLPHEAQSLAELFLKKMTAPPRRASELVPGVHAELEDLLLRAMATEPDERPPSARALLAELRALQEKLPTDDTGGG